MEVVLGREDRAVASKRSSVGWEVSPLVLKGENKLKMRFVKPVAWSPAGALSPLLLEVGLGFL